MVRTRSRRRITAVLSGMAVAAASLLASATPASAAAVPYNCGGADPGTTSTLNGLAGIIGTPPPPGENSTLDIDVDVTTNAPGSIDVGGAFSANFTVTATLPPDLVDGIVGFIGPNTPVAISNAVGNISVANATPGSLQNSPPFGDTLIANVGSPLGVAIPTFGDSFSVTGGVGDSVEFRGGSISFSVFVDNVPLLGQLNLNLLCTPLSTTPFHQTAILQPGPPIAPDVEVDVALGGTRVITIPTIGYPEVSDVELSTLTSAKGTFTDPVKVGNSWRTTYTHNPATGDGVDAITYESFNAFDGGSSTIGNITVNVLGNECEVGASGSCSLEQIIETTIVGDVMYMEQAGGSVLLEDVDGGPIVLNGEPQVAYGELNELTVVNPRGNGAPWTLHGIVTDFLHEDVNPAMTCAANVQADWDYQCIPGSNLAWNPAAEVAHLVVPGDVAATDAGAPILVQDIFDSAPVVVNTGLGTTQHTLCSANETTSGGTFKCGAGLALVVPASASAGLYSAVLTLTLA